MDARQRLFGNDLRLVDYADALDLSTRASGGAAGDLALARGADNAVQALTLRLRVRKGELAPLGWPDYGSRLHELIGELNTQTVRNRAKMYVLTALADEPRIRRVVSVQVTPSPRVREQIDIDLVLEAIESVDELRLSIPFSLAGGAA